MYFFDEVRFVRGQFLVGSMFLEGLCFEVHFSGRGGAWFKRQMRSHAQFELAEEFKGEMN